MIFLLDLSVAQFVTYIFFFLSTAVVSAWCFQEESQFLMDSFCVSDEISTIGDLFDTAVPKSNVQLAFEGEFGSYILYQQPTKYLYQ